MHNKTNVTLQMSQPIKTFMSYYYRFFFFLFTAC